MSSRTLSVSQLTNYIKGVFEDELILHDLYVEGEIAEIKQKGNALFITLKDEQSVLYCVGFGKFESFEIGDNVSLYGSVSFYEKSGRISFVFKTAAKKGYGNLLARFNELKDKLTAEGLFDRKKKLPVFVRKIAVVTSETGAVIHDFIRTVHRRYKCVSVVLYPSAVQGQNAVSDVISAVKEAQTKDYDLIVIARGGGSSEDLGVFNDESLVRAVADCPLPVISAVGHETDFTLCDFAASVRAGTPSMAGELISRIDEEFIDNLGAVISELNAKMDAVYRRKAARLYRAATTISYKSEAKLERARSAVLRAGENLVDKVDAKYDERLNAVVNLSTSALSSVTEKEAECEDKLGKLGLGLDKNNPLRILSMGYAKLCDDKGKSVVYDDIKVGDDIKIYLEGGRLTSKVTEKRNDGGHDGT